MASASAAAGVERTVSLPSRPRPRVTSEGDVKNVALRRTASTPFVSVAPFVFHLDEEIEEAFEQRVLDEVQRLDGWLQEELKELKGHHSATVIEPLRVIVASNEAKALRLIQDNSEMEGVDYTQLRQEVKAAFAGQSLILAAWARDHDHSVAVGGSKGLQKDDGESDNSGGEYVWRVLMLAGIFLALVHVAHTIPDCTIRCFLLIVSLLTLQLSGVVPQYCIGLLVPVFSTALRVLPGQTIAETANLCFGAMMNQMTALVIGSFTINAVFLKCQLEIRFISAIASSFGQLPKTFLLMLMLGCMMASAVTFVTLLALSAMFPVALRAESSGGKTLLLGVGISCTLGGALTPLSGTSSLIVLSTLTKFGLKVDFLKWVVIALPCVTFICIISWLALLLVYGSPPTLEQGARDNLQRLGPAHFFFLGCSVAFILGCIAEDSLSPWIGSSGNLGLMLTALSFGSGFLTKSDFAAMPWEVLMILFGVNVTAFTLKESGLALNLATMLIPVQVYNVWLWLEIAKITGVCLLLASLTGQTVFATLGIPVVAALGAKLYCPLLTALLATLAIHCGICSAHSSTDLMLTFEMAGDKTRSGGRRLLSQADFLGVGLIVGLVGWLVVMSSGYVGSLVLLGVPPQPIIIKKPTALIPSVIWLGNETTSEEKVEILKGQMEGEDVNDREVNATFDKVASEEGLRPAGKGEVANITIGKAQAPNPITAKYKAVDRLPHLLNWVHKHRGHQLRRRKRPRMLNERRVTAD